MYKIFDYNVARNGEVAWDKEQSIKIVKKTIQKPSVLVTRRTYETHGGFTDATIYPAEVVRKANGEGYLPSKTADSKLADAMRYGGKTKIAGSYFFLVESTMKGKRIRTIENMPLYLVDKLKSHEDLVRYCRDELGLLDPDVRLDKIKTCSLLKLNGALVYLTGRTGSRLITANAVELVLDLPYYEYCKKITECDNSINDEEYFANRQITLKSNGELYKQLLQKYTKGIFSKRINNVRRILENGESKFENLSLNDQLTVLREILRLSTSENQGADLTLIDGSKKSGVSKINKRISDLESAFLITQSVTGLYMKKIDLLRV